MTTLTLLTFLLFFPGNTTALFGASNETGFWEDFANNFATDLAPIISLFGEQVTKQFLSESTTILDTIVFAVGPLGIITAIVSCIRVRGGSFLRSIVGRAREPHGMAEIELCSSTSDDVCEMWSNGGVCRVFGRPRILEFVYRLPRDPKDFYATYNWLVVPKTFEVVPGSCGIETMREFLTDLHSKTSRSSTSRAPSNMESANEWRAVPDNETLLIPFRNWFSWRSSTSDEEENRPYQSEVNNVETNSHIPELPERFAPFPNLALNIGVQRTSAAITTLWIASVFGILLQCSFFGYATWATWCHPGFYEEGQISNANTFFTLTVIGTACIVIGMALCARLIDGNSQERRFSLSCPEYTDQADTPSHRVFWIQAGGQRIGDQEFEAFAHDEAKTNYITSWRVDGHRTVSHTLVYLATGLSFFGWAIQFIGLRGQHATVSLYQLCCTVTMSIIRAFIRSYRSTPENGLKDLQKEIKGHELDWQAIRLWKLGQRHESENTQENLNENEGYWTLGSEQPKPFPAERISGFSWQAFYDHNRVFIALYDYARDSSKISNWIESGNLKNFTNGRSIQEFLDWPAAHRESRPNAGAQLLHIRSRMGFLTNQPPCPSWEFEVRNVALQLKRSLRKAAETMALSNRLKRKVEDDPILVLWSASCRMWEYDQIRSNPQDMPICFHMMRSGEGWDVDENQLEAALGLWSWTLKRLSQRNSPKRNLEEEFREGWYKTIAIADRRDSVFRVILDCWGVPVAERVWVRSRDGRTSLNASSKMMYTNLSIPIMEQACLDETSTLETLKGDSIVLTTGGRSPILQLMAQDIFTTFIESVCPLLQENIVDITIERYKVATPQKISLVDGLVEALVSEGLATRNEAIMSIIPGLCATTQLSHDNYIQRALILEANLLKRRQQFNDSERIIVSSKEAFSGNQGSRGFKCLFDIYRSEFRWMAHHGTIFSRQDCLARREVMSKVLSMYQASEEDESDSSEEHESDSSEEHESLFTEVVNCLLSTIRPTMNLRGSGSPPGGQQQRQFQLPKLDQKGLNELDLDKVTISETEALKRGLVLSEQFNLVNSDIEPRKQLLRWAIESDCSGLLEDLWAAESDRLPGNSVFSHGYDEIFWAISLRTNENDMVNTILILLPTIEVSVSTPFHLEEDLSQNWWATSRQRESIKSRYGQFNNILDASIADCDGLELVQLLLDEVRASELTRKECEDAAWKAADLGRLQIMNFLLSLAVKKLHPDDTWDGEEWQERLLYAAKWGHIPYLKCLLEKTPSGVIGEVYKVLGKAKDKATSNLSDHEENLVKEMEELNRSEAADLIQEKLDSST